MRLYHRTSRVAAEKIVRTRRWESKDSLGYVWFSNRLGGVLSPESSYDKTSGYGDAIVTIEVSEDDLESDFELNDEFPDGEQHYTTTVKALRGLPVEIVEINPDDLEARRKAKRKAKVQAVIEESISVIASDPGMQAAVRKRAAERAFAERVAGPQLFQIRDRVIYTNTEEAAIPESWVGRIVEHHWYNEDRPVYAPDSEGGGIVGTEERPYHSYVVDWREPNGEHHEGIHSQDEMGAYARKNGVDVRAALVHRFNVLIETANRRAQSIVDYKGEVIGIEPGMGVPFPQPIELVVDEETALQGRAGIECGGRGCACAGVDDAGKGTVYIVPALLEASSDRQVGVLAHELAHVSLLQRGDETHSEREADSEAERLFGYVIRYDDEDVQTIGPGMAPRPAYLDAKTPKRGTKKNPGNVEKKRIREPYLSGVNWQNNDRSVDIIEEGDGEFTPFATIGGRPCKGPYGPTRVSAKEAKAWARRFLAGEVDVDVWPNPSDDYRGQHKPASRSYGAPFHDVEEMSPGFYEHPEHYYFGMDRAPEVAAMIVAARGKPNHYVTVYRAVPKGVTQINAGDFVTPLKFYAQQHLRGALNGKGRILSRVVRAGDLFFEGNSIMEWGYDPKGNK